VFPRDFLADFGFRTLRSSGRIELMRLELGGIIPVSDDQNALEKAWSAVQGWRQAGAPAPVR